MSDLTPEAYAEMKAQLVAYELAQAHLRLAEENEYLEDLRDLTCSESYQTLLAAIPAIKTKYRDDTRFSPFIENLVIGMPALANAAGPKPTPPAGDE